MLWTLTWMTRASIAKHDINDDKKIAFLEWAYKDGHKPELSLDLLMSRWLQYDVEGKGYLTIEEAHSRKAEARM